MSHRPSKPDLSRFGGKARKAPPDRPSFESRQPLPIREIPAPRALVEQCLRGGYPLPRAFRMGQGYQLSVIITREMDRWHLSLAHPTRMPTWDECAEARYRLLPEDLVMALLLPPRSEYVNHHEYCLQMMEIRDPEFTQRAGEAQPEIVPDQADQYTGP